MNFVTKLICQIVLYYYRLLFVNLIMNYDQDSLVDMIFVLGESERNPLLAERLYRQKYPERRHPHVKVFEKLLNRFLETGSVAYKKKVRVNNNNENNINVLLSAVENPHISQREISTALDISQCTAGRILRKHHFHPYHVQLLQELKETDIIRRQTFCNWALQKIAEEVNFFDRVLFSDEATFRKNGNVNRHNFHYYSDKNPVFTREMDHQHRWSLNVWGGIIGDFIVGPFFFDGSLTGIKYEHFLRNDLPILLEDVPLNLRATMWLQHDGAPPHYSRRVRNFLNNEYANRWVGRGSTTPWPSNSPDLTKLDYFLWGYVKEQVYQLPPTTQENMKNRIKDVFQNINHRTLRDVSLNFIKRVEYCANENGRHFEQLI